MLQVDSSLISELHSLNFEIAIETNGTIICPPKIAWICVSPKNMASVHPEFPIKQTKGHELKVVYTGQDLSMYDELKKGFEHLYLQPCYNEALDAGANWSNFPQYF